MKKNIIMILLICTAILLAIGAFFSYKQAHTMVLQGEVEVKTVNLSSKLSARIAKINVSQWFSLR